MIIVSQDYKGTHEVQKRIVNFDNIQYLMVDIMISGEAVIIFKDNTTKEENLKKCNCILGIYKTGERAKEILNEIAEQYALSEMVYSNNFKLKPENNVSVYMPIYEMPEE